MITIRFATVEDASRLLEIYSYYVLNTAVTFEVEVPTIEEFAQRIAHTLDFYPYIVAERDGVILGYAYASRFRTRKAYDYCVESSIYIDKDARYSGVGTLLLQRFEQILQRQGIINIEASITTSHDKSEPYLNDDSLRFHKKHGYRFVGEFHNCGYKFNRWYSMVFMEKIIGEYTDHQQPISKAERIFN